MGTRLWLEQAVKQRFPHLRYVRVHTCGRHQAMIYAWDGDLQLNEKDAAALRRYACGNLSPYICFSVKPYEAVAEDVVPVEEVPETLRQAAVNINLNQEDIFAILNDLFAGIVVSFNRYDPLTGTVYIHVYGHSVTSSEDRDKLERYAEELIPVGSRARLIYYA